MLFTLREQLLGGERIERLSSKECFSLNEEREKRHARKRRFTQCGFLVFFPATAFLSLERTLFYFALLFLFVIARAGDCFLFFFLGTVASHHVIERHHEP